MNGHVYQPQPGPSQPLYHPTTAKQYVPRSSLEEAPYALNASHDSMYRHVESVPAPQPRIAYEPPVFRTFQDRKRAKETALRARSGMIDPLVEAAPASELSYAIAQPSNMPPPHMTGGPGPSTLAMMGLPTNGLPPLPPPRSPTVPKSTSSPQGVRLSGLPAPGLALQKPPQTHPRPLPSPTPSLTHSTSSHTSPSFPASPAPSQSPSVASIERSDTLASIKSVDRVGFSSSRRPLPKTPVGVNSSKSLDRGIAGSYSGMGDNFIKDMRRRQPSAVSEESIEGSLPDGMNILRQKSSSPTYSTKSPSSIIADAPSLSISSGNGVSAKQTETAVPSISFSVEDDSGPTAISIPAPIEEAFPPSFTLTGPPTISVSSEDNDAGLLSIAVPTISLPDDPPPSSPLTSPTLDSGSALLCAGCQHPIIGRIVNAMKKRFHPPCFRCDECGELLEHVSSYEREGKAYCHLDYHDKFAHQCFQCKTPIVDSRFITLDDPELGQRYYHELHFFCSECGDPFLDPSASSAPGTELHRHRENGEEETNAFVLHKGHPYCERCHLRLHKPKCRGCSKPIPDIAVTALDAKWHKECFVCNNCQSPFANDLFFPFEGLALCTSCYQTIV